MSITTNSPDLAGVIAMLNDSLQRHTVHTNNHPLLVGHAGMVMTVLRACAAWVSDKRQQTKVNNRKQAPPTITHA